MAAAAALFFDDFVELLFGVAVAEEVEPEAEASLKLLETAVAEAAAASTGLPLRIGRGLQRTLLNSSSGRIMRPPVEVSNFPCRVIK